MNDYLNFTVPECLSQVGRKGGHAGKGRATTKEKTSKAATQRWLFEEPKKHEDLVLELEASIADRWTLPYDDLVREARRIFRSSPQLQAKVRARQKEVRK
jgi:hypothetical protein